MVSEPQHGGTVPVIMFWNAQSHKTEPKIRLTVLGADHKTYTFEMPNTVAAKVVGGIITEAKPSLSELAAAVPAGKPVADLTQGMEIVKAEPGVDLNDGNVTLKLTNKLGAVFHFDLSPIASQMLAAGLEESAKASGTIQKPPPSRQN